MKKRVYTIGKVTGLPEKEVERKFRNSERILRDLQFIPLNPVVIVNDPKSDWSKAMKKCISVLVTSDAVYKLRCADDDSKGASLELQICEALNIPVFTRYHDLRRHFGMVPQSVCEHPKDRITERTITTVANVETIATICLDCSKKLNEKVHT